VLDGRYHHRVLRTPREVRRAVAHVLLNARRHLAKDAPCEVARPRTWLLRIGWRRHGLVDPAEAPGTGLPGLA